MLILTSHSGGGGGGGSANPLRNWDVLSLVTNIDHIAEEKNIIRGDFLTPSGPLFWGVGVLVLLAL